jgi:tetratricopeptide (TPR) repeat protein
MDWSCFEHLMQLRESGQFDELIAESERLVAQAEDDDDRVTILRGEYSCYCMLGDLGAARRVLERIRQLHPSDLEVRLSVEFDEARFLLQEGKIDEGISAFAAMLRGYGEVLKEDRLRYLYEEIQTRSALALADSSRFAEALPILKEAVSFSFEEFTSEQRVHFMLGVCQEAALELDAAKREYLVVVRYNLKNDIEEQARYRLSRFYYSDGALAQARKHLEVILEEFPDEKAVVPRKWIYQQLSAVCRYLGDKPNEKLYMELSEDTATGAGRKP